MAVPWGLVVFLVGILYGYLKPGRQDKVKLLKTGFVVGVVLAVLFALVGSVADANPLGLGAGILATILGVLFLTVLFIIGVWIGDWLEGAPKRA